MTTPAPRIRDRQPALFEAFEKAERACPRGAAARELDAQALERNATRLRDLGECWNTMADELDREAAAIRAGGDDVGKRKEAA